MDWICTSILTINTCFINCTQTDNSFMKFNTCTVKFSKTVFKYAVICHNINIYVTTIIVKQLCCVFHLLYLGKSSRCICTLSMTMLKQFQFETTGGRCAPIIHCEGVVCLLNLRTWGQQTGDSAGTLQSIDGALTRESYMLPHNELHVIMIHKPILNYLPIITNNHPPSHTWLWLQWFLPLCIILLCHTQIEHL